MTPETYNLHFLNENKIKKNDVKEPSINKDSITVKDVSDVKESCVVKEALLTNPQ
jgi:hypothetical protein